MKSDEADVPSDGRGQRAARAPTRRRIVRLAVALVVLAAVGYGGWRGFLEYLYMQIKPAALAAAPAVRELPSPRASGCAGCHRDIYDEWRSSLHGQAMSDPFFVAEYDEEKRIFACLRCHAPLRAQQPTIVSGLARIAPARPRERPNPDYDRELHDEGVTCLVCHQRGDALVGPLPYDGAPSLHAVTVDPDFGANALCARCHAAEAFPFSDVRRPVLPTLHEHDDYRRGGGTSRCVECHFSRVDRPIAQGGPTRQGRRHTLLGARDRAFLRDHLTAGARCDVSAAGSTCVVSLTNRAGHRYPTGEPGRELVVEIAPDDGSARDARSILRRMDRIDLVEKPGEDNTLLPHETREVKVSARVPASLRVRFCLYEASDPLLKAVGVAYEDVCQTLHAFRVDATGAVTPTPEPAAAPSDAGAEPATRFKRP